jgi:hypothetical protein
MSYVTYEPLADEVPNGATIIDDGKGPVLVEEK